MVEEVRGLPTTPMIPVGIASAGPYLRDPDGKVLMGVAVAGVLALVRYWATRRTLRASFEGLLPVIPDARGFGGSSLSACTVAGSGVPPWLYHSPPSVGPDGFLGRQERAN